MRVEEADSTVDVPLELTETGSAQDIDLVVVNDLDLTYAISRFDEHSMRTALAYVSTIERPITRAVIWSNLFSALRCGELDPRDYIHSALAHMAEESEDAIFERLLATIRVARSFLPHSSRDRCDREILNTLAEFMRHASRDRGRAALRLLTSGLHAEMRPTPRLCLSSPMVVTAIDFLLSRVRKARGIFAGVARLEAS